MVQLYKDANQKCRRRRPHGKRLSIAPEVVSISGKARIEAAFRIQARGGIEHSLLLKVFPGRGRTRALWVFWGRK